MIHTQILGISRCGILVNPKPAGNWLTELQMGGQLGEKNLGTSRFHWLGI